MSPQVVLHDPVNHVAGVSMHRNPIDRLARGAGKALVIAEQPNKLWWDQADELHRGAAILLGLGFEMLAKRAMISYPEGWSLLDRANVQVEPAAVFDARAARKRAMQLLQLAQGRPLVVLGKRAARAFHLGDHPFLWEGSCTYRRGPRGPVLHTSPAILLPHPSGRNRYWMNPVEAERAGNRLHAFLRHYGVIRGDLEL